MNDVAEYYVLLSEDRWSASISARKAADADSAKSDVLRQLARHRRRDAPRRLPYPTTAQAGREVCAMVADVYRKRVADDETDSGHAEQKLAMRWESLNREHDRIGSDRFWEIIYEGFRKAGYTTAQLRHLLGMEINPK